MESRATSTGMIHCVKNGFTEPNVSEHLSTAWLHSSFTVVRYTGKIKIKVLPSFMSQNYTEWHECVAVLESPGMIN